MMKFLLIFFIFMVLLWQWRHRHSDTDSKPSPDKATSKGKKPALPTTMVACAQCGLHVPEDDASEGSQGTYCSMAHQQIRES
jgi:uncharacterized protein